MIKNYFKVAIRSLLRNRVFSFINIMGLAVGMTACFLIFQYVMFEMSYDNFHSKAGRIYRVVGDVRTPSETIHNGLTATPIGPNLKKDFPEVEDFVRLGQDGILVHKGDTKFQEKRTLFVDSGFFHIFDFPLIEGDKRTALTAPLSVVMSQSTAKKYFGKTDPLGQQVQITGAAITATVTGVMKDVPANSQIEADMLISLTSYKLVYGSPLPDSEWTNHSYYTYILFKPNTNVAVFEKKLPGFMEFHHGKQARQLQMFEDLFLEPLRDVYLQSKRDGFVSGDMRNVYIFSIVAIFILLIACINFVNLTTARSTVRAKEVGIRKVVGAARGEVVAQFMGESVIICWMAFLLSILLASLLLPLFNKLAGKEISLNVFSHGRDLLLFFGSSTLIGIVAGFYPSLVLSSFKAISVLKGRFATSTQGLLLRKGLVVFQFTVSIVFIIGTLVVNSQLNFVRHKDLGFSKDQEVVIFTNYDKNRDAFKNSLASMPGVLSSTYSSDVPGSGHNSAYTTVENKAGGMQQTNLDGFFVDFNFIPQYDLKIVAGRAFSTGFPTDSTQAMIINESAARMLGYHSPQEAVGRRFEQWGRKGQIIGVVRNFNYTSLKNDIQPFTLRIEPNNWGTISIKVAATNLPVTLKAIESSWNRTIPNRPFEYNFLDENFNRQYGAEEKFGNLFLNFAILAIFISCLGVLGLASYSTFQRTKEMGVRKVLGASAVNIVRLLSTDFIRLVGLAFLIAAPLGWFIMHQWLGGFAYRTPLSWGVFALAGGLSLLVVMLTIGYQAIKAAVANPVKSLRTE